MILAVFQETSANSCLLTEREGWCCQQCADSRHMGELATLHGTRQHYDLTISNVQMMGCTDSTESARVISKESLEIVQIVWSVHTLSLSLSLWHFYFSEFALGCAWCNLSRPPHTHTHTRWLEGGQTQLPTQNDSRVIGNSAVCVYELYLCMHADGRSLFWSCCFVAHTPGQAGGLN